VALFVTLLGIFIKRALRKTQDNPSSSQKFAMMKKAWKFQI
jgi:hypothetical protein